MPNESAQRNTITYNAASSASEKGEQWQHVFGTLRKNAGRKGAATSPQAIRGSESTKTVGTVQGSKTPPFTFQTLG